MQNPLKPAVVVILAHGKLKQEDHEFKASVDCLVRHWLKKEWWWWKDAGLVVKSAACREDLGLAPRTHVMTCNSFISPVPGDLITLSDLWGYQEHTWYAYIHAGQTFRHIKWILKKGIKNLFGLAMVVHLFNPSPGEADAGEALSSRLARGVKWDFSLCKKMKNR